MAPYVEVCGYGDAIDAKNYDLVCTDADGNNLPEEPTEAGRYQVYARAKVGYSKTDPISYTLVDPSDIGCYCFGASDTLVGETPSIWGLRFVLGHREGRIRQQESLD